MERRPPSLLLLPLSAAVLQLASLPGWAFGPAAFLVAVPRIAYWERGGRWWGDYLGGYLVWFGTFSFLGHTSWLMPACAAGPLGLWWAGMAVLYRGLRRRLPPSLAGPLAITACEYLRGTWPMAGVPWGSLGLGQADLPGALFLARGVGETGFIVLAAFTGGWLYALARRRAGWELAVAPALWLLALALALWSPPPAASTGTVRCLAVQPNLGIDQKVQLQTAEQVFRVNLEPMIAAWEAGERPQIVLWAETMYPFPLVEPGSQGLIRRPRRGAWANHEMSVPAALTGQFRRLLEIARWIRPGGYFITGSHVYRGVHVEAPHEELSPRTTGMLAFDAQGDLVAHRPKSRLVPFGETLPFEGVLPGSETVAKWIFDVFGLHPLIERVPPGGPMRLSWPARGELVLGSTVCWENPFEWVFRDQADLGAEAFVILSNEAWFGLGAEMDQMVAATRFRAVETGRAILRVTNTGVTVLVGPDGALGPALPRGEPGRLAVDLPLVPGSHRTAFMAAGWALFPGAAGAGILLAILGFAWPRRRVDPPPRPV